MPDNNYAAPCGESRNSEIITEDHMAISSGGNSAANKHPIHKSRDHDMQLWNYRSYQGSAVERTITSQLSLLQSTLLLRTSKFIADQTVVTITQSLTISPSSTRNRPF